MRLSIFAAILMFASAAGASEKGLALAQDHCARCHAIDPAKPWNSIGSTPSFMLMAKKLDRYETRILSVAGRRPHIAQKLNPTPEELEAILAYVRSLAE